MHDERSACKASQSDPTLEYEVNGQLVWRLKVSDLFYFHSRAYIILIVAHHVLVKVHISSFKMHVLIHIFSTLTFGE